jgi:glucosamine--fructose-6-phosphate aminotransferase (isomerizing)
MCGIVGYVGYREAAPVLLNMLERVTYRGYDSFGMALLNGHGINVVKMVGTAEEHRHQTEHLPGTLGVGHTRWATVGGVSEDNAHPHLDCSGDLAIVHNGDIDNFHCLKERLQAEGHQFRSQTDSEVIAHLIEAHGSRSSAAGLVEATHKALAELEGPLAIVVLHRPSRQMIVARRESPLVIGIGEGETFMASDVPAILPYTNRVVYLEDGDMALARESGISVWQQGRETHRSVHQVNWTAEQMDKGGYDHFMLKEIYEQPQAIRDTAAEMLTDAYDRSPHGIARVIEDPSEVLLLGCGTSYHAALLAEQILSRLLNVRVTARVASELDESSFRSPKGLVVAFSQSGETSDTITALRRVKETGYRSLAITNVMGSSITRLADASLYTRAGPEMAVASTKSFVSQLVAIYLLARQMAPKRPEAVVIGQQLRSLPGNVSRVLANTEAIQQTARDLAGSQHLFIVAKGLGVPVALEGALKLKELAYIHAEGYPAGELKHGSFAMLDQETPVVAIVPTGQHRTRVVTAIREIKARGPRVVALADREDTEIGAFADTVLPLPKVDELLAPVLQTVVLQLLSYYAARERGCPIDRPRNLAKSVTVP